MKIRLSDGDRVGIIGGGPAGSFAALHLLKTIRQHGPKLDVMIFEPRDFQRPGPGGCNRCAGILSSRLLRGLDHLGISLPDAVVQSEIQAYAVHLNPDVLRIDRPDLERRIVSVYRGGGPRLHQRAPLESFDGYLLSHAIARGAKHIPERVRAVTLNERPVIHTARNRYPAALIILSSGINSRPPLHEDFGYRPPRTAVMAQDEFHLPEEWASDLVSAYFRNPPGLVFGALIPKGRYVNISLLGRGLATDAISEFIEAQGLADTLNLSSGSLCGCTPRIAIGLSKRYFGDRWVAVGDAAVTRLYKDGIGSAYSTAEAAIHTAIFHGISKEAFHSEYRPFCKKIDKDNTYGQLLFRLWSVTQRFPTLLKAWARVIQLEEDLPLHQRTHTRILWSMFTGDEPYRDLVQRLFSRESILGLRETISVKRKK